MPKPAAPTHVRPPKRIAPEDPKRETYRRRVDLPAWKEAGALLRQHLDGRDWTAKQFSERIAAAAKDLGLGKTAKGSGKNQPAKRQGTVSATLIFKVLNGKAAMPLAALTGQRFDGKNQRIASPLWVDVLQLEGRARRDLKALGLAGHAPEELLELLAEEIPWLEAARETARALLPPEQRPRTISKN